MLVDADTSLLRVRLDHVQFADGMSPPLVNQPVILGGVIPGNVSGFRVSVTNVLDSGMRIWDFSCPPNYAAKSVVLIMAGTMMMDWGTTDRGTTGWGGQRGTDWGGWNALQGWGGSRGWGNNQVFTGAMAWEQGTCSLVRAGSWEPGKGMRWER